MPLVRGPSAQGGFGLGDVSPWVRVSSGGGCPQAMGEAGVEVRVRCVEALAPEGNYVPLVGGSWCSR